MLLSLYSWGWGPNMGQEVATALGVFLVTASVGLTSFVFIALLVALWPRAAARARPNRALTWAPVAVTLVLTASWIRFRWIGYDRYVAQHDQFIGGPSGERLSDWLQRDAFAYAFVLSGWLVEFAPFLMLAGVLGYLHAWRRSAGMALLKPPLAALHVLLFAAFVGTTGGELYGYRLPIAFVVAFVALWLVTGRRTPAARRIEKRFEQVDRDFVLAATTLSAGRSASRTSRLLGRLRSGFLPLHEVSQPVNAIADARAHELGPHASPWANGVTAVRWGALVAVAPALHYLYVVWSQWREGWALGSNPFGSLDALQWVLNEYAYWLVASFVLGALYLRLPGRTGVAKGAVLGAVFGLAQGAAEALPGRYDVLSFPYIAAEAIVVLAVVGLLVDLRTVRQRKLDWQQLLSLYDAGEWQLRLRYLSIALPIVFVLAQQIISGAAQQTITELINATQTLPSADRR